MTQATSSGSSLNIDNRLPTVIYVMGAGRSGSTILGVALGNCAGVFYAGELEAWLRRAGAPNFSGVERTRFWNAVRQNVHGDDLFGDAAWRHLEYSLAPFRFCSWRKRRQLRHRYRTIATDLYREIAVAADSAHVVDTSHYPLRARELRGLFHDKLYLIYLARNPQDVVESFRRRDVTNAPKSTLAAHAYLWLTHLLSALVFLRHRVDRRLVVRYEDFLVEPELVLRRILEWVDLPGPIPDLTSLSTGIPFQGNRLLEAETISFRTGEAGILTNSLRSYVTKVLQLPSTLMLARLAPNTKTWMSND